MSSLVDHTSILGFLQALQDHVDNIIFKLMERENAKQVAKLVLLGYLGYNVSKVLLRFLSMYSTLRLIMIYPLASLPGFPRTLIQNPWSQVEPSL